MENIIQNHSMLNEQNHYTAYANSHSFELQTWVYIIAYFVIHRF